MKELFKKLIEVRDVAQQIHWNNSGTGFKHEALESFYVPILEHTDLLIEVYQGQFGIVDTFGEFDKVDFTDTVAYFEEFAKFVDDRRVEIPKNATHLNGIIDDILVESYKLLYKMKYLK